MRTNLLLTLLAAASACSWSDLRPPAVTGVAPVEAPAHLDVELRIQGERFEPMVKADFDDPGRSTVDAGFELTLVSGEVRVPLSAVMLQSRRELRATLPAGAPAGRYAVEVRDPRGQVARLPDAFDLFVPECTLELAGCEDGDLCTEGTTCMLGRCIGGAPVTCTALDACHEAGSCDPATGCSNPPVLDGTPCFLSCAAGEQCTSGVCTVGPGGCNSSAPLARLTVSPGGGTSGSTLFTLDASASTDADDPFSVLQFRFDSDGNGNWSGWSSSFTHAQVYSPSGLYAAAVEVRDSGGLTGIATILVVVAAPGTEVPVTTAADEKDAGARPTAPGGTGLSLREAVTWVNAQGTARTITLAAPLTVAMSGPQTYMTLTAPGASVVGEPGVILDFGGINQPCFTLGGAGQRLVGVTLRGCDASFVRMDATSGGSRVAQVTFDVTGARYWAYGIEALSTSATLSRIGPGNDLSGLWWGLKVDGANYRIFGNRFHDNAIGAKLGGLPVRLWQNVFTSHVRSLPKEGIGVDVLDGGPGPVEILQNVFDLNAADGVQSGAVGSLTVRNNLFTGNGGFGLNALAAGLTHDHNGYFGNASGPVAPGPVAPLHSTGPTDLLADPLYVDAPGGDHRLLPASPAIDAGIDTVLDVNGPAPGLHDGLAPDLGAVEMR